VLPCVSLCLHSSSTLKKDFSYSQAGAGILYGLTPEQYAQDRKLGTNQLWTPLVNSSMCQDDLNGSLIIENNCNGGLTQQNVTIAQGFGIELITTFVLVLVVLSLTDPNAEKSW
jgi:glycerol uptake facilitator-like aquaporin